jgi:hypothetical protein
MLCTLVTSSNFFKIQIYKHMKTKILFLLMITSLGATAQNYKLRINGGEYDPARLGTTYFTNEIRSFEIKKVTADNPVKNYQVGPSDNLKAFVTDGAFHVTDFAADIRDIDISIYDEQEASLTTFVLKKSTRKRTTTTQSSAGGVPKIKMPEQKTARDYVVSNLYNGVLKDVEGVGLKLTSGANNTKYQGDSYIHLFFDQNGNSLIHSTPIGIERANYVVHIIYLVAKDNPLNISFAVEQKAADVEEGVFIRGDGNLQTGLILQGREEAASEIELEWHHYEQGLTSSSKDISFDIIRNGFTLVSDESSGRLRFWLQPRLSK